MQYTITISQTKAIEWGLNAPQALLFAFVYECPSWANPIKTDGGIFYALSKAKIVEELPLLTDKPDTAYRLLKQLQDAGVLELSSTSSITLVRLTEKGRSWNRKVVGSEKYPTEVGKISEEGRKNIRGGSEKYPTNQDTSNQDTNQEEQEAPASRKTTRFDPLTAKPANVSTEAWSDWCQHRREIRKPLTAATCKQQAAALASHPAPDDVLRQSIGNGWTGIFPDKVTAAPALSRHHGFDQRDYTAGMTEREDGSYAF
jgi:DNA-binding PadR family transcriptional regulator